MSGETLGKQSAGRGMGGNSRNLEGVISPHESPDQKHAPEIDPTASAPSPSRYRGLPVVFIVDEWGSARPAPFLMSEADVVDFFRLGESATKFPSKTIQRYRRMGLRSVRVGRRRWFTLPDVLDFLDKQQVRLTGVGKI